MKEETYMYCKTCGNEIVHIGLWDLGIVIFMCPRCWGGKILHHVEVDDEYREIWEHYSPEHFKDFLDTWKQGFKDMMEWLEYCEKNREKILEDLERSPEKYLRVQEALIASIQSRRLPSGKLLKQTDIRS